MTDWHAYSEILALSQNYYNMVTGPSRPGHTRSKSGTARGNMVVIIEYTRQKICSRNVLLHIVNTRILTEPAILKDITQRTAIGEKCSYICIMTDVCPFLMFIYTNFLPGLNHGQSHRVPCQGFFSS